MSYTARRRVYPALMQARASLAKTDRPNRCRRYAPLFPGKTSLTSNKTGRRRGRRRWGERRVRACVNCTCANAPSLIKIGIKLGAVEKTVRRALSGGAL